MKGALEVDLLYVKESMKFYKAEISNEANSCTESLCVCALGLCITLNSEGEKCLGLMWV